MQSFEEFHQPKVEYLFTDIDDTLTTDGRLETEAYEALWALHKGQVKVIPVTGRPAGWCELIARQWPVTGVIGENGGFFFHYKDKTMHRYFVQDEKTREENRKKLEAIQQDVLDNIPGAGIASDQFCRMMDLAVDFCEDVEPLPNESVQDIVETFKKHGATAKVSSIHVNGWFGDYDKLSTCKIFAEQVLNIKLEEMQNRIAFVGDSPNDEPMFDFFNNSFAVANIKNFIDQLTYFPSYIAQQNGGKGFHEIAQRIVKLKK